MTVNDVCVDRHPRQAVIAERTRLGLSVRKAAALGGIANTSWGNYEAGLDLTDQTRLAVAKALDWPEDWPTNLPPIPESEATKLLGEVQRLALVVQLLTDEAVGRLGVESDFAARLAALEAGLAQRLSP